MKKRRRSLRPRVLFNASVILAGIKSPKGGSARALRFAKEEKIKGIISEIIFDETLKHADKLNLSKDKVSQRCLRIFKGVILAPAEKKVRKYQRVVVDEGDCHVLASGEESGASFLVTLDKKHLLILKGKIKRFKIVTPGEMIKQLRYGKDS
ncbi:MAG: PIN domain-containing protein [Patescibacteria group bacterium]